MAWTTPITWASGTLRNAAHLNTYLYANMIELAAITYQQQIENYSSSNITTTSTTPVLISANFTKSITIKNNRALIVGAGVFHLSALGPGLIVWLYVNGAQKVALCSTYGIATTPANMLPFMYVVTGLSPGVNTFDLYWQITAAGTGNLRKNETPAVFHVREV